jgi:lactate 2-monooxygenase
VFFNSKTHTSSNFPKAVELGATVVLVGHLYVYGLAIGGERGKKHILDCMLADTHNSLANLKNMNLSELGREELRVLQQPAELYFICTILKTDSSSKPKIICYSCM